jgi:hypothetical protein
MTNIPIRKEDDNTNIELESNPGFYPRYAWSQVRADNVQ